MRDAKGAAALEGILSILLMLGAFYTMWGVAIVVYNHSRLTTATSFAAHGALTVFEREAGYISGGDADSRNDYLCLGRHQAATVSAALFHANLKGLAKDPFTGKTPDIDTAVPSGPSCQLQNNLDGSQNSFRYQPKEGDPTTTIKCYKRDSNSTNNLFPYEEDPSCDSKSHVVSTEVIAPRTTTTFSLLAPLSGGPDNRTATLQAASEYFIHLPESP
jgi:hypothetical protein